MIKSVILISNPELEYFRKLQGFKENVIHVAETHAVVKEDWCLDNINTVQKLIDVDKKNKLIHIKEIYLSIVSQVFRIPIYDIIGRSRKREIVEAREALTYFLRNAGISCVEIGKFLNRNHTSIMYLYKICQDDMVSTVFENKIKMVKQKIDDYENNY